MSFTAVQTLVLKPLCVSCHSGAAPAGNVDLTTYQGVRQVVVPGNPSGSLLFGEASGGHMTTNVSQQQLELLGAWILAGAPNN